MMHARPAAVKPGRILLDIVRAAEFSGSLHQPVQVVIESASLSRHMVWDMSGAMTSSIQPRRENDPDLTAWGTFEDAGGVKLDGA